MIQDKVIQVTTDKGQYTLTITGEQLKQTIQRRMNSLVPNEKIRDITEVDGVQTDLTVRKGAKA